MKLQIIPPIQASVMVSITEGMQEPMKGSFQLNWYTLFNQWFRLFNKGFTGTVATAKLTSGGANGSITFENGVVTAEKAAT
jgi:hypothetical protein